jgi:hypothetical protein
MSINLTETLIPNLEYNSQVEPVSDDLKQAIDLVINEKLNQNSEELQKIKEIMENWVSLLWNGMLLILNSQDFTHEDKEAFKQSFYDKLKELIINPDHGIAHSYCVYRGMIHLSQLDGQPIQPNTIEDTQAQLMALLHDAAQDLPFAIQVNGFLSDSNQKNEHARIMAAIVKLYGSKFGFRTKEINQIAKGIQHHDISFHGYLLEADQISYVAQLLHDADKLFGASLDTDIQSLVKEMLKRNYEANRGPKGSYLIRTEFDEERRSRVRYGDRCFSDSVSVVRKEFQLPIYTQAGQEIAQQRREIALKHIQEVYGYFFDLTNNYLKDNLFPKLGNLDPNIQMSITGMDQPERLLTPVPKSKKELLKLLQQLYSTPIKIDFSKNGVEKISDRYNLNTDARGLKIHIVNLTLSNTRDRDIYLDPSIARFCLIPNGKDLFLAEISKAFII